MGILDDISLTLPKDKDRKVETRMTIDQPLVAPIASGAVVGSVALYDGEQKLVTRPLIALQEEAIGGWWKRAWDSLRLFFLKTFNSERWAQ